MLFLLFNISVCLLLVLEPATQQTGTYVKNDGDITERRARNYLTIYTVNSL